MKRTPRGQAAFAALIGAVALGLAACTADVAPSAPAAHNAPAASRPANDLLDLGGTLTGTLSNLRLYDCATPDFGSVTQVVGPAGGIIKVGPHKLAIPAGALDRQVTITASAPEGQHVVVDFEPEGLRFRYAAVLTLSYAHCEHRPLLPKIVYINDLLSILELLKSVDDPWNDQVSARLRHFSGYAIAE